MNVGKVTLNKNWRLISEVSDGSDYLLQNLSTQVEFLVTDLAPTNQNSGNILESHKQLYFKKVFGDLYMRSVHRFGNQVIMIEKVEV